MTHYLKAEDQTGLTLIELSISMSIVSVLAVILSQFLVNGLTSSTRNFTKTVLQANTKQGIETIERDIKAAQTVEDPNRWPDNNAPGAPGNLYSWHPSSGSGTTLVLAVPARDVSGNLIYADALHNTVQTNDLIYYLNSANKILYKRTIANPATGNAAKTTCPPALATSACPQDARVVEDVADLSASYLDSANVNTATPTNAGLVEITLKQTQKKGAQTFTNSFTSQVSLRNK